MVEDSIDKLDTDKIDSFQDNYVLDCILQTDAILYIWIIYSTLTSVLASVCVNV